MKFFSIRLIALTILCALLTPGSAKAMEPPKKLKDYPRHKIEFVVRWGAGGAAGAYARHFAKVVNEKLKLNVVAVNMVGASGMNAINYYMEQPADGYYILNMDSIFLIGSLQGKTKYTLDDFLNICRVQNDTAVLFVRPDDKRFPTFEAMVKWAKENPKKLTIATEGAGALGDVILAKLEKLAGFTSNHVPFAKFGEKVTNVIGGHVDILYEEAGDVLPYVKDGKLKPILVFAKKRLTQKPYDITCTGDFGWDHDMALWRSIAVKKGTPQPRARYLEQVFKYYHETPEGKAFEKELLLDLKQGFLPWDETENWIREQYKTYKEIMTGLGIIK